MRKNISMIRGDTLAFGVKITFDDNPQELESAYFTCKRNFADETPVFQKKINYGIYLYEREDDGLTYIIRVAPRDTEMLEAGEYYYDLQIGCNGDVFTILHGVLMIEWDVTHGEVNSDGAIYQSKTVTPTTATQIVTADVGYEALEQVTVNRIPTEYVVPSGTVTVTANGTVDVTQYASADINVSASVTGTKQISITTNGVTTEDVANYADAEITVAVPATPVDLSPIADALEGKGITIPADGTVADYANLITTIEDAIVTKSLTEYENDRLTATANSSFQGSTNLARVSLPNLVTLGEYTFNDCPALAGIVLPNVEVINKTAFQRCYNLAYADFGKCRNLNGANIFYDCTSLNVLILRGDAVCPVTNIAVFGNSPFASGKAGGTLYVPDALISAYQSASVWSTILGYANNNIQSIEGSIYATQYADGTPIE